jgi:hypothetical protein
MLSNHWVLAISSMPEAETIPIRSQGDRFNMLRQSDSDLQNGIGTYTSTIRSLAGLSLAYSTTLFISAMVGS